MMLTTCVAPHQEGESEAQHQMKNGIVRAYDFNRRGRDSERVTVKDVSDLK